VKSSLIRYADIQPSLWKNGGGTTREIWRFPSDSTLNDFGIRCSIAEVCKSGPFSNFAGYHRLISLLQGPSMELRSSQIEQPVWLKPFKVFEFDGSIPIECTISAATLDFNLMIKNSDFQCISQVHDLRFQPRYPESKETTVVEAGTAWIFFVMSGSVHCKLSSEEEFSSLGSLDALVMENFNGTSILKLDWSASVDAVISCHRISRTNYAERRTD
jgi:environmental stress-induced protein Ves